MRVVDVSLGWASRITVEYTGAPPGSYGEFAIDLHVAGSSMRAAGGLNADHLAAIVVALADVPEVRAILEAASLALRAHNLDVDHG